MSAEAKFWSLLAFVVAVAVAVLLSTNPVPQSVEYHQFADNRRIWGIDNFWNVASNLPFLVIGAAGALWLVRSRRYERRLRVLYGVFFAGVFLTGFGSSYYHLAPDHHRLVWDRLPMVIAFVGIFCAVVAERVTTRAGVLLAVPLMAVAIFTVWYWIHSEQHGAGDLRPYATIQLCPMALIPVLLLTFRPQFDRTLDIVIALGFYGAAKATETFDRQIWDVLDHSYSGHAMKHLFAGLCAAWVLRMLVLRRKL